MRVFNILGRFEVFLYDLSLKNLRNVTGRTSYISFPLHYYILLMYARTLYKTSLSHKYYLTRMTRYLLVDQNICGLVIRSTYCLLASRSNT